MQGKIVLVTGGSRGIGEMITRGYLANGAKVYITSRKSDECIEKAKQLSEEYEANCIAIPEDISTIKDKTSALSAVMMKMGEAAYKANQENNPENPEGTDTSNENKEDVVDADFEEVKDNEEKKDAS